MEHPMLSDSSGTNHLVGIVVIVDLIGDRKPTASLGRAVAGFSALIASVIELGAILVAGFLDGSLCSG